MARRNRSRAAMPLGLQTRLDGSATTALVLGILAFTVCGLLAPFAMSTGYDVNKRLAQYGAPPNGKAIAGFVPGLIGTLWILAYVAFDMAILGVISLGG
jgi:hypothetical protein